MSFEPKNRNADYGIDAPGVIRNLILVGVMGALIFSLAPSILHFGPVGISRFAFALTAVICLVEAALMLLYSKWGKFKHRDKMLDAIPWRGDERVLDVGTGRGLLLVGAAKRLTTGTAVGIDIWSKKDLSSNTAEAARRNLEIEGVLPKSALVSEGAQKMSFVDSSFDIVVSNLCIHNIASRAERDQACKEIARVLKPGGHAIISDFKNTGNYAESFKKSGLSVKRSGFSLFTFPPLRIVTAIKKQT